MKLFTIPRWWHLTWMGPRMPYTWYKWWAWRPVITEKGEVLWLQTVYRCYYFTASLHTYYYALYTPGQSPDDKPIAKERYNEFGGYI